MEDKMKYLVTVELLLDNCLVVRTIEVEASEGADEEELYEAILQTESGFYFPSILDWS